MNTFRKVAEPDDRLVTVILRSQDAETKGEIYGPSFADGVGITQQIAGQAGDLSGAQAFAAGVEMANKLQTEMVIVDPQRLWKPEWGTLVTT